MFLFLSFSLFTDSCVRSARQLLLFAPTTDHQFCVSVLFFCIHNPPTICASVFFLCLRTRLHFFPIFKRFCIQLLFFRVCFPFNDQSFNTFYLTFLLIRDCFADVRYNIFLFFYYANHVFAHGNAF